jgi:hypothetical protein
MLGGPISGIAVQVDFLSVGLKVRFQLNIDIGIIQPIREFSKLFFLGIKFFYTLRIREAVSSSARCLP